MPMPAAAPGGAPSQPPMGMSPATGPTPNKGLEAAGLQRLGVIVNQLADVLKQVGPSTDVGQAVNKAIGQLAKFIPAGSVTPSAEKNMAEQTMMRATQNNQQMQALAAQARGAGQGGPSPGGAAPMPGPQGMAA